MVHSSEQVRKEFAQRLKTAAKQAGYEERGLGALLAKITDSTPKAASKWLSAESIPRPEKMAVIAKKLKVSQQWLQFGEGTEIRESSANYSSSNVEPACKRQRIQNGSRNKLGAGRGMV